MKHLKQATLCLAAAMAFAACSSTDQPNGTIVDVPSLMYQTPHQIRTVLGEADSTYNLQETGGMAKVWYYFGEPDLDVVFSSTLKTVRQVTVYDVQADFAPESLTRFGLEVRKADRTNEASINWNNYPEYRRIGFYVTQWDYKEDDSRSIDSWDAFFEVDPKREE